MLDTLSFHRIKKIEITPRRDFPSGGSQFSTRDIVLTNTRGEKFTIEIFTPMGSVPVEFIDPETATSI